MYEAKRRPRFPRWVLCIGLVASGVGCDKGEPPADAGPAKSEENAEAEEGAEAKADAQAEGEAQAEAGAKAGADAAEEGVGETPPSAADVREEVAQFMKDQRKKGCEMLPAAMVAERLEVPEGELRQQKIMGCIYSWKGDGQTGEASIMSIWIKKTPEVARVWFDNMTKSKTPEEIDAEVAKALEMAKDQGHLDTKMKKKVAGSVGGIASAMTPDAGYQYEDVLGVGDAARVKTYDGSLTVLVGNMIFNVRAYKGERAAPPDMKVVMSRDIKKITEAAQKSEAEHMEKTRDVRRQMGTELAKAIVAGL